MSYANLHEFLDTLFAAGEMQRVAAIVDPQGEIAEITDRVSKSPGGGTALFFSNVSGCALPIVTNLFGSPRRLALALGLESVTDLTPKMEALLASFDGEVAKAPAFLATALDRHAPVPVVSGPCDEVVEDEPDLRLLPALSNWEGDGGRYFTLPLVFSADPVTGRMNCGMYRVQVLDATRMAINFGPASGGGSHVAAYAALSRPMPVAIVLGGVPETIFSATVPLPPEVDELSLAGFLRGRPLEVVPACGGALSVPSDADVIIEGEILPGETTTEGPFGNHTGLYAAAKTAPVLRVRRIKRRADAVVPATIVGPPPMEDLLFVRGWERLLLPWLRLHVPEVHDIRMILPAAFHRPAVVAAAAGVGVDDLVARLVRTEPLKGSRLLVIVDPDVALDNYEEIFWRGINALPNAVERLATGHGQCLVLDARSGEKKLRVERDAEVVSRVSGRWKEYGLQS